MAIIEDFIELLLQTGIGLVVGHPRLIKCLPELALLLVVLRHGLVLPSERVIISQVVLSLMNTIL